MFDLRGKTALITGSTRGIGRSILLALAQQGAQVILHGHQLTPRAEETLETARKLGANCHAIYADMTERNAAQTMYDAVKAKGLSVDILVLNASVQLPKPWPDITDAEFDEQMNVNLLNSLHLIQRFVPEMRARGWGRVITVGSVQQCKPHKDMLVYAASKTALWSVVRNLARQLAPDGVTVNNLAPGVVNTDRNLAALADAAYAPKVLAKIPMGAVAEPEDIAAAAVFMASKESWYMTGQDIYVDGGMSL